jgi:hypothetical protein
LKASAYGGALAPFTSDIVVGQNRGNVAIKNVEMDFLRNSEGCKERLRLIGTPIPVEQFISPLEITSRA